MIRYCNRDGCAKPYVARATGGRPQKFCSMVCRSQDWVDRHRKQRNAIQRAQRSRLSDKLRKRKKAVRRRWYRMNRKKVLWQIKLRGVYGANGRMQGD